MNTSIVIQSGAPTTATIVAASPASATGPRKNIPGVKISLHRSGETCDPDTVRREPDEAFLRARAAYASFRLPDLDPLPVHAQVCLYTSTPDEDFIVDRAPGMEKVWLASACSGHGFKFAILVGKIAASLAVSGAAARPDEDAAAKGLYSRAMRRFSLDRFKGSRR